MKDQREDFADQLGRYLVRAGFTQQELANRIGMHRNTIVKWMNRTSRPLSRGQVLHVGDELFLSKQEREALIQAAGFSTERWPTEIWTVGQQRDMFFTGRDEVFQSLRELLVPGSTTTLTQAISGLGGIGKTHIAVEYAYRFHQDYEAVFWLQADSWESLVSACMKLADELELPEQKEADQVIEEVRRWLRKHHNWLLILDNVENPQEILSKFLPSGHQGCVLVTTRIQSVEPLAKTQVLSMMSEHEGVLFLLRRTTRITSKAGLEKASPGQYNETQQIWQDLGGLPLALDQAGAYILETKCSFSAYREQYNRRRAELLLRRGKRFIGHDESVATTFSLAFERVEALNPVAADVLRVCSLLYSEAIPEELFQKGAEHLGPHLTAEKDGLDLAIGVLQDYSLVQRDTNAKTLTVHRLVQAVLQDNMQAPEQIVWTERVIAAMSSVFPQSEPTTWSQCERLVRHAQVCATHTQSWENTSTDLAFLFFKTADYLADRAQYTEAEPLFQRALRIWEQALGPDHPQVAEPLNGLASLYDEQGRYAEAESLYLRILRIQEQEEPGHPQMAEPLNNLAILYREQGRYAEAESLYLRALHILKLAKGPDDPDMAYLFNNLAILYSGQEKDAEAEPLFQQALHIREQALGPDHPHVAHPLHGLANLYARQGRYAEAEPLFQRALRIWEQALGPDHPQVAYALHNLAHLYSDQGKDAEAEPLFQQALHIREQALGPDHPHVAHPLHRLANLYARQGRYAEAEPLFQRALRIREQALGSQHLETAEVARDFAEFQHTRGNRHEAEPLYQYALTLCNRSLGQTHPKTMETRKRYATLLREMGRQDEAALLEALEPE